jgi:hypothetical protein
MMQLQFARTTLLMAGLLAAPVMAAEFEEDKKRKYQAAQPQKIVTPTTAQSDAKVSNATSVGWDDEAPPADWLKGLDQTSY